MAAKDALSKQLELPIGHWEEDARKAAVKQYKVTSFDPDFKDAESKVHNALLASRMTSVELGKHATAVNFAPVKEYPHWGAEYYPQGDSIAFNTKSPYFNMTNSPKADQGFVEGMVHELGHKVDHQTIGHTVGGDAPYNTENVDFLGMHRPERREQVSESTGFVRPDPRLEGIADGFMDRHASTPQKGFAHQTSTSYGQMGENWNPAEKAIYHATRAHMAKTGRPVFTEKSRTPGDAEHAEGRFLHSLTSQSPHAVQGLKDTGLWDVAQEHINKYTATLPKPPTQMTLPGF